MTLPEGRPPRGEEELRQGYYLYGKPLFDEIVRTFDDDGWDVVEELSTLGAAPLAHHGGNQFIHYLHLHPRKSAANDIGDRNPVLMFPGVRSGIGANVAFATALAWLGNEVIVPHQNRTEVVEVEAGRPVAARNQALDVTSIPLALGRTGESLDAIFYSWGGLVGPEAVQIARAEGWDCFNKQSRVAMVAPAGLLEETPNSFRARGLLASIELAILDRKLPAERLSGDFRGLHAASDREAHEFQQANPELSALEVHEAVTRTTDVAALEEIVGEIAIFAMGRDRLFSAGRFARWERRQRRLGALGANTVVHRVTPDRGSPPATHWAIRDNPLLIARAVDAFLHPARQAQQLL